MDLDERFDWIEVSTLSGSRWVRGQCHHLECVPVTDLGGAVVAQLCRTCDEQLPA